MVYITSDLFGPSTTYDRDHHAISTFWSPMVYQQHAAGLGKRKRHDADEGPSSKHQSQHWIPQSSRDACRPHPSGTSSVERNNHSTSYSLLAASERRPVKQMKRLSPKATLVKSTSHLMDIEPDGPSTSMSDLRPCHACNLAPKRKKDLVNYLDCKRCDGRTCYICARQCVGGCGKSICRKCNVEVGEEGESWCLDCYSKDLNS